MQSRFLGKLVIGGVAMLGFATQVVQAEENSSQWQSGPRGRVFTNVEEAEVPVPVPATSSPNPNELLLSQSSRLASSSTMEDQTTHQYRSLIEKVSQRNGVDPDLVDAMMKTESNYNRWAVSSKGARGLMQLIPETGRRFGVLNFFDPEQNIEGGVRYIKYLLDMFHGDVELSLAAYNAGENLVARLGAIPPFPETRSYVRRIRAVYSKPSKITLTAKPRVDPVQSQVPIISPKDNSVAAVNSAGKVQDAASNPISKWFDERGVVHFSNIEPIR